MSKILITGTNRGIGLELVRQYRERGDDVIAVCRKASDELQAVGARVIDGIDVASADDVAALADALDGERLDILLNNAGIAIRDSFDDLDYDAMVTQFAVNTLGPLRVTRALAGNLREGGKVGIVTSRVGSIGDNSSGNNYGYRASKAAANMVGMNLRHDLGDGGIAVVLLHPGYVKTDMTHGSGNTSSRDAARGLIARMDELTLDTTGTFWHAEGYPLPW